MNRKKQITALTTKVDGLTKVKSDLENTIQKITAKRNNAQHDYELAQKKTIALNDTISYLRETQIPELKKNVLTEQDKYDELESTRREQVAALILNQDIAHVGANLSTAVDKQYKTELQEKLSSIKQREAEWGPGSNFFSYASSGTFAYFNNLGAKVKMHRGFVHEDNLTLNEKLNKGERKLPQVALSRGNLVTIADFMKTSIYEFLKEKHAGRVDGNQIEDFADDDLVLSFKDKDAYGERPYHNILVFSVEADKENAYGAMVKNDLRLLITASAVGAFENALGRGQYVMARKIADKYLTEKTSSVFAPMIKDIAEKDPKAAGYFMNLQFTK